MTEILVIPMAPHAQASEFYVNRKPGITIELLKPGLE